MIRVLDGLALALAGLVLSALALGWWRPEDLFLALLGVLALRAFFRPYPVRTHRPGRAVAVGVIVYAAVFSFITLTRHWAFRTHALDLGYYVQVLWSLSQGLGAYVSLPPMHAWGDHFSPILYLLVPLFVLFPGPGVLLVVQSAAFSLGALPLYALARRRLGSDGPAAAFALLYLLSPTLHGINIRDFHPQALAIPLLLAAVYFFEARRSALFWISAALALATREDAALPLLGLSLWAGLVRKRYLTGALLGALALVWLFATTTLIIPYFRGAPYPHLGRYGYLGNSVGEILLGILLQPLTVLGTVLRPQRLLYLASILAPWGFLPLLAPASLIPALPALAQNLLSADPVLFHHRTQYNVFILPFLALAAVSGFRRLSEWKGAPARRLLICAFFFSLALTSRTVNDLAVNRWWPGERERAAHAVLSRVPPLVSISADERFIPHLSHRPKAFVFPTALDRSEYVLINIAAYPWRNLPDHKLERQGDKAKIRTATAEYSYEVAAEQSRILLLKKAK